MGLKWTAAVDMERPVVAKSNEHAQQHSWKARALSARGPKITILAEDAVGLVVLVHL
jgi:hypothetical protein